MFNLNDQLVWEQYARVSGIKMFYTLDKPLSTSNNTLDSDKKRIPGLTTTIEVSVPGGTKTLFFKEGLLTDVSE